MRGTRPSRTVPVWAVRRELEPVWAADTQRRLLAMGLVPLSLIESISTALQGATQ